jgi:hypothetical protein
LSNANQTSLNLKNLTTNLNDPKTLLMLQQTLDSARTTFQNTQKITADLDDLTGNPEFRSNLRNLVNGLGKLVSSAEQLEQQAKLAQSIEPLGKSLSYVSKLPIPAAPARITLGQKSARSGVDNNGKTLSRSNSQLNSQESPIIIPNLDPPLLSEPTDLSPK